MKLGAVLVGQGANNEPNDRTSGDRGEDRVAAIIVMDPVIAVWRIIETPIIIVANDDRVIMVAIISTNLIVRHIVAIIDIAEGWPRIIIERSVTTPIPGARRIVPEIVPTVMATVVVAIIVTAIIPVEIAVVAVVPVAMNVAVVVIVPVVAMIVPVAAIIPIIVISVVLAVADVAPSLPIATVIPAIIGIAPDLTIFLTILEPAFRAPFSPPIFASIRTAFFGAAFSATLLAAIDLAFFRASFGTALLAAFDLALFRTTFGTTLLATFDLALFSAAFGATLLATFTAAQFTCVALIHAALHTGPIIAVSLLLSHRLERPATARVSLISLLGRERSPAIIFPAIGIGHRHQGSG